MRKALRDKLIELVRGEEGVALVVTLALFFFLWLIIAGVYAVGTSVRERIHLQNAVDAAAYSAAVVQADTLSRIATINRAMSWTYVQMTRRQMDYIVWKWMDHTYRHFSADRNAAANFHKGSPPLCPAGHGWQPKGWFIGADGRVDRVKVNGGIRYSHYENEIGTAVNYFTRNYLNGNRIRGSFYDVNVRVGSAELQHQIRTDKTTIGLMNDAEASLSNKLQSRMHSVAESILNANVTNVDEWVLWHDERPSSFNVSTRPQYFQTLANNNQNELKFVRFGNTNDDGSRIRNISSCFATGIDSWFRHTSRTSGIERRYVQLRSALRSEWSWWSSKWSCYYVPPTPRSPGHWVHPHIDYLGTCPHDFCVDTCQTTGKWFRATLRAGDISDDCFNGAVAKPVILNESYFGPAGTIMVAASVKNRNPWASIMQSIAGIYKAFDHYCDNTVVFASAKAGYRNFAAGKTFGRDYRIDWRSGNVNDPDDEQYWNLYTSDWDAVMVPVRMSNTKAENGSWEAHTYTKMGQWISALSVKPSFMCAGGSSQPSVAMFDGQLNDNSSIDRWRWYNWQLRQNAHTTNKVHARWQIQNNGARLTWRKIEDRMFH